MKWIWPLCLLMLVGCTLPEIKKIELTVEKEMLYDALKNIVDYEEVEIKPQSTVFKSDATNVVLILLTNPSVEVTDNAQRYEHARKAALLTVNSIENHSDYDFFLVTFIERTQIGKYFNNKIQRVKFTLGDLKL